MKSDVEFSTCDVMSVAHRVSDFAVLQIFGLEMLDW